MSEPLRDVVFIHKKNDWKEELPYALRSLMNIPHRKVWFFGYKPVWVRNVEYVPMVDLPRKWWDIHNKYRAFIEYAGDDMTNEVIHMYDDVYFLDDRYSDGNIPTFHWGTTDSRAVPRGSRSWVYRQTIVQAGNYLKANGVENPLNYALHVPFVFYRDRVPTSWVPEPPDEKVGPVSWRTIAGNTSGVESIELGGDVKVNSQRTLAEALAFDTGFLSTWNENFKSSGAMDFVRRLFPLKCKYER